MDKRDDAAKLIAMDVQPFDGIVDGAPPLRIQVQPGQLDEDRLIRLKGLLSEFPGESRVFMHLGETDIVRLPVRYCVEHAAPLVSEVRVLLGAEAVLG